jgi:hypothetical protein
MAYKRLNRFSYFLKVFFSHYILTAVVIGVSLSPVLLANASAGITNCPSDATTGKNYPCPTLTHTQGGYYCGLKDSSHTPIYTTIDFGCEGKGNPMLDLVFSIIRILSDGVGIVIVASMIVAGIQYSASSGDPNATNIAIKRVRANVTALLFYIFGYALINFIVPGQILK